MRYRQVAPIAFYNGVSPSGKAQIFDICTRMFNSFNPNHFYFKVKFMCGIYKIENKINGHVYIGQSINIARRWRTHKNQYNQSDNNQYESSLYRAIRKYGLDNFSFEVLEECSRDQLNQKEIYWIKYYNSYLDGYNDTSGGDAAPPQKVTPKILDEIKAELRDDKLTQISISKKYGVSENIICGINTGYYWYSDEENYPIRKRVILKDFDKRKPPKKQSQPRISKCPPQDALIKVLRNNNGNFAQVGRIYGVGGNAVRKWCKKYNLSHYSSDYKT